MLTFKQFVENYAWHAQEGEGPVVHHLSNSKFNMSKARPYMHFGTSNAARARASTDKSKRRLPMHTYSVRLKSKRTIELPDLGEHTPKTYADALHDGGHISDDEHKNVMTKLEKSKKDMEKDYAKYQYHDPSRWEKFKMAMKNKWKYGKTEPSITDRAHYDMKHITKLLDKHGIDTIKYKNDFEDPGSTSYIAVHPDKQVRVLRTSKPSGATVDLKRSEKYADEWGGDKKAYKKWKTKKTLKSKKKPLLKPTKSQIKQKEFKAYKLKYVA